MTLQERNYERRYSRFKLREILATHEELARKVAQHDRQIATLFEYVKTLLEPSPAPKKPLFGFIHSKD